MVINPDYSWNAESFHQTLRS